MKQNQKTDRLPPALVSLIRAGKCPHAVLLTGSDLQGRKKAALTAAAALLCENRENAPCGQCRACIKTKAGSHPDLLLFEGTEKAHTVGVDVIRKGIRDSLYITPNEAACKVYVLLDADGMNGIAQNAFLKTLEEPPEFVCFVLAGAGKEKLTDTVLSRCTLFALDEKPEKEGKEREIAVGIVHALLRESEFALLNAMAPLQKNRNLVKKTAVFLQTMLRDAAVCDTNAALLSGCEKECTALSMQYSPEELFRLLAVLRETCEYVDKNANENLLLTWFCSRLAETGMKTKDKTNISD